MPLDDRDIFTAICNRYPEQPMEFIMAEYEKARNLNRQIELRETLDTPSVAQSSSVAGVFGVAPEVAVIEEVEAAPAKKKITRRSLKVKPENAITDDVIYCCVCGEPRLNLTAKHLAQHGLTVAEYKDLCRYAPDQPLMSRNHLIRSREVVAKAQQARLDKKTHKENPPQDQPI